MSKSLSPLPAVPGCRRPGGGVSSIGGRALPVKNRSGGSPRSEPGPAYRGKGLAGALLSEALKRARSLGARSAYVISDLPFYEKLGFEKARHYTFYRKVNPL